MTTTARTPADFPIHDAENIVASMILDAGYGRYFPDMDKDDLVQEGVTAALAAWSTFNPDKSAPATFITLCAKRRIIDLLRSRGKSATREHAVGLAGRDHDQPDTPDELGPDPDQTLEDWIASVYARARRAMPAPRRRGRKWFKPAQVLCVLLIMRQERLTCRGAVEWFSEHKEIMRILRLRHVPRKSSFGDMRKFRTENPQIFQMGK